jgi:hypothetical protein
MRYGGRAWAAAVLGTAAVLAPASEAGAATCARSGEQVEAQNSYVQVVGGPDGDFACLRSTGRRHRLGFEDDAAVTRVLVRGRHVAYTHVWYDGEAEGQELAVMNVGTGTVYDLDAVSCAGGGSFGSFVLKPNGATAWILDESYCNDISESGQTRVKRCSRRCLDRDPREPRPTRVDRGRIDQRSLRLSGSKISWINDGKRRRATLR